MSDEIPSPAAGPGSAAPAHPANAAKIALPPSIDPAATIPPTPVVPTPATGSLSVPPAAVAKKDVPLPDIVLGGPQPFNAERSPLIRLIKLCTVLLKVFVAVGILGFMLYYYLSIANPKALPKYDPKTGAGATPFKALNQVLAMPAQVMGKTKDVVATNDARVAELDHVIKVSEGQSGDARNRGSVYRPPTAISEPTASVPATTEAAPEPARSAFGQILALPGQVVNKTKDVVGKNNARVGVLDGVIANPEGMEKGAVARTARVSAGVTNGPPPPPAKTSVSSEETAQMTESLINFSLAQGAADAAANPPAAGQSPPTPVTTPAVTPSTQTAVVAVVPPASTTAPRLPKKIQLGGGITITSPGVAGTTEADEIFLTWAMRVKVSGIFPGTPPRVMLNDRLVRAGEAAHLRLKIVFETLDLENHVMIFRDPSGATVARSY